MSNDRPLTGDNPQPWFKQKKFIIPIALVVLAIIGGATGGNKTTTSSSSTTSSTNVSNPLDTSANHDACHTGRFTYAENSQVISDWVNSAATDADLEAALKKIGDFFYDVSSTASGDIQTSMMQTGMLYKKARVAAISGDSTSLLADLKAALPYADLFNSSCKSIGEN